MSNITKITPEIRSYIISRKRRNRDLSCRLLAEDASKKFSIKIAKSSVNFIIKSLELSSPVGRRVAKIFRPSGETSGAGFCLLLGANFLLGLSKILAASIKLFSNNLKVKTDTLEAISEAWILSKALYNVDLQKIEDYSKNDLWFIIGKKINKGVLKKYIDSISFLQPINFQIVSELSHILQDVHYLKFSLADGSSYFVDGQLRCVWKDNNIPIDFCTTIEIADRYVKIIMEKSAPFLVVSAKPDAVLGDEFSDFIFSIDGSASNKRIRKIELFSPKGELVKEVSFVPPERRKFIIGIWPWQYKLIGELENRNPSSTYYLEPFRAEFFLTEDKVRFTQHAKNIDVTLKLIAIKSKKNGPAKIGLLTNFESDETETREIVEEYIRRCPDVEAGHKLFLSALKTPLYFEDFLSSQKILEAADKLREKTDPDGLFGLLVDILNLFTKRSFFSPECYGWNLMKMRELFYKKTGLIKRDMGGDVSFNILGLNELHNMNLLNHASIKFNELPIFDDSGRKIWLTTAP